MNELLEIDKLYSTIFDDAQSFHKYYKKELNKKTSVQWGDEFKSQLKIINEHLKSALLGTVNSTEINLWFSRIRHWNENIKVIKYRINQDILEFEANLEILPEGYYPTEMIESELRKSGKTYDEFCTVLKNKIETHISDIKEILDYINAANTVADFAFSKMKIRYASVLSADSLKIPKLGLDIPMRDFRINIVRTTEDEIKPSTAAYTLLPFEITIENRGKIATISEKLTIGRSPFITNPGHEFKLLFSGSNPPSIIINWRRAKNELHYFIDLLYKKGIIDPNDTRCWEKTSSFFTIKGERVTPDELRTANRLDKKDKKKEIESLFL